MDSGSFKRREREKNKNKKRLENVSKRFYRPGRWKGGIIGKPSPV
jgi:hypothetical protein